MEIIERYIDEMQGISIHELVNFMNNNVFVTIGLSKSLPTVFISHSHKDLIEGKLDKILEYIIRYCRVMIYLDENDEEYRDKKDRDEIELFLIDKMNEADKCLITYSQRLGKSQWCEFEYNYIRNKFNGMKAVYNIEGKWNSKNIVKLKRYRRDFDIVEKVGLCIGDMYMVSCRNRNRNIEFKIWCEKRTQ